MIGFYAMGGGLGHLTRVRTFIDHMALNEPFRIITNNAYAHEFFPNEAIVLCELNDSGSQEELFKVLKSNLHSIEFSDVYIDAFPFGILHELSDDLFKRARLHYLARRLKWSAYYLQSHRAHFHSCYQFEPLEKEHLQFIHQSTEQVIPLALKYNKPDTTRIAPLLSQTPPDFWLIVHFGSPDEVKILIDHAQDIASIEGTEPHLVLLSNVRLGPIENMDTYTDQIAIDWFPHASKIFSGAGFNSWYQLVPYRDKHVCIPFERRFDDQFWRCQQAIKSQLD